jgi:EAL domain-containing protein (putative c-di-GMP-specific phosphodiesterase class I)
MLAEWHVSLKPQRVSAALASGVNPGSSGAASSSASLAHTPGSTPRLAGGRNNSNSNLHAPAEEVAKALGAGWLELWYQPKIGSQTLDLRGAEALIRMRHPQLGIVPPAGFMPQMAQQYLPALSQFVIARAVADWRYFLAEQRPLDLSINLPISFIDDPGAFEFLCRHLPDHLAFEGLILEVDGSEISRDLSAARDFAKQARLRKVAISVDRLGDEWTALLQLRDFPSVEIKIEPELVAGCAHDQAKQTLCRHIVGAASQFGARTVAVGVETYADFVTARELGFDMIQGFLFAKPMGAQTFMRSIGHDVKSAL